MGKRDLILNTPPTISIILFIVSGFNLIWILLIPHLFGHLTIVLKVLTEMNIFVNGGGDNIFNGYTVM